MSRIGKYPVQVPEGVSVNVSGQSVSAKGKLGEMSILLVDDVEASMDGGQILIKPRNDTLKAHKMWGTTRSLISNIVTGVSEGYVKNLEVNGVGYRAQVQGKYLVLQLGYSHEVKYLVPQGINIQCADQTHISVKGSDKQLVGQVASEIRGYRPPEPYKGKGIKYDNEIILRKEGKKK